MTALHTDPLPAPQPQRPPKADPANGAAPSSSADLPTVFSPGLHLPSLAVGLGLMVALTVYPPLVTHANGRADHGLALIRLWAMSAGLVRGVGFIPRWALWRWLFSGWACLATLALAAAYKFASFF